MSAPSPDRLASFIKKIGEGQDREAFEHLYGASVGEAAIMAAGVVANLLRALAGGPVTEFRAKQEPGLSRRSYIAGQIIACVGNSDFDMARAFAHALDDDDMTAILRIIAQSAYELLHSKDTKMSTPISDQLKHEEETRKIGHLDPDLTTHRRRLKITAALVAVTAAALLIALVVAL